MPTLASRARCAAAVVALPALLVAAGCGESGKEEVQSDVNAICKDFRTETKGLFENVDGLEGFASEGKKALPAVQKADRELTQIKASEDVRRELGDEYTAFVANFRRVAVAFRGAIQAAEQGNQTAVEEFGADIKRLDKESQRQARKLGFDDCARG